MKYLSIAFFLVASAVVGAYGQNSLCPKLKVGSTWVVEDFSGKDKSTGKTTFKVAKLDTVGGKYDLRISAILTDAKGKQLKKIEVGQACRMDSLFIDMKNYFHVRDNASYKWSTTPSFLTFPTLIDVGQQLPPATITYTAIKAPRIATQVGPTASKNDQIGSTATCTIDSRVVESKEDLTTPAGTFTCYKIKSNVTIDNELDYAKIEQARIDWYVPGVGIVKSEVYKKGKKITSSQMVKKSF
jgi:hypothetical protein